MKLRDVWDLLLYNLEKAEVSPSVFVFLEIGLLKKLEEILTAWIFQLYV